MYLSQSNSSRTTGWYRGRVGLCYYDYDTDEIVAEDFRRHPRHPSVDIQSLEFAAAHLASSQTRARQPHQFPDQVAHRSPAPERLTNLEQYTLRPNSQGLPASHAVADSSSIYTQQPPSPDNIHTSFNRLSLDSNGSLPSSSYTGTLSQSTLSQSTLSQSTLSQSTLSQSSSYPQRLPVHFAGHTASEIPWQPTANHRQTAFRSQTSSSSSRRPTSGPDTRLHGDFRKAKTPKKFFTLGKVFHTLWNEAAGNSSDGSGPSSRALTTNSYGEVIHSKARRFVVVKESNWSCSAIPITTYSGQGVAKSGVKKSDHGIIFTGKIPPSPTEDERPDGTLREAGMQPYPIRIDPDIPSALLDGMSRIDFGKPSVIHHFVKVKSFGMVNRASMQHLIAQHRAVYFEDTPKSAAIFASRSPVNGALVPPPQLAGVSAEKYTRAFITLTENGWSQDAARAILAPYMSLVETASFRSRQTIARAAPSRPREEKGEDLREHSIADDARHIDSRDV